MPPSPFIAASAGAEKHLQINPLVQRAMREGIHKDIWGSTWSDFMGIGSDSNVNQITDSPSSYAGAYTADAVLARCVDIRGAAVASVPLYVYQGEGNARKKVKGHPALDTLKRTNPLQGFIKGSHLLWYSQSSRDLHGHVAWRYVLDSRQIPLEIYWLQPEQYSPIRDPKSFFGGLKVRVNNKDVVYPANTVLYAPTANTRDPLSGTSKVTAIKLAINLRQYGLASNVWFFQNNQRPDVVVTGPFQPTEQNVSLFRRIWKRAFAGDGSRGPAFLPNDMKVTLLTQSNKDAEWLGLMQNMKEEICNRMGVPLPVYGDLTKGTYNNTKEAFLHFWQTDMIPELDQFAELMTQQYLWRWPGAMANGYYLGFDYTQIEALQEDANAIQERLMQFWDRLNKSVEIRVLTPNQARQMFKMEAQKMGLWGKPLKGIVPGGDTFYLALNQISIQEASVQANIDSLAARGGAAAVDVNDPDSYGVSGNPATGATWKTPASALTGPNINDPNNNNAQAAPPTQQALPPHREAKAMPNPVNIRTYRLQPIQDRAVRKLKRHFQDLQTETLRNLRMATKGSVPPDGGPPTDPYLDPGTVGDDALAAAAAAADARRAVAQGAIDVGQQQYAAAEAVKRLVELLRAVMLEAATAAYEAASEDFQLAVTWVQDNPWLGKYMGQRFDYIKGIDDNTQKALYDTLLEGSQAGETIPQLSARVKEVFTDAIGYRSDMIARTETIQAYSAASIQAYREAGILKAQMYDGTTYDAECASVNGQVVTLDEAARLMFDEHPNGTRSVAPYIEDIQPAEAA